MRSRKTFPTLFLLFAVIFFNSGVALACTVCGSSLGHAVRDEILHTRFLFITASILGLFILFLCLVILLSRLLTGKKDKHTPTIPDKERPLKKRQLSIAGMLLGGAIAGFLDGVLFHQVLQTHGMVSDFLPITTIVNVKVNMFWDGVFTFFTLVMLLASLLILWRVKKNLVNLAGKVLIAWIFLGFGLFNFLEGLLDHEILALHHVIQQAVESEQLYADILFLIGALGFLMTGIFMIRKRG